MLTRSTDQLGFSSHLEERDFYFYFIKVALCKHNAKEMIYIIYIFSLFETVDILMNVKMLYHVVGIYPPLERSFNC